MAQWLSSFVKISLHIICTIPNSIFVIVLPEIVLFSLVDILLSSEWLSGSPVLRVISQKAALKKHSTACFAHFCKDKDNYIQRQRQWKGNEKTITKAKTMKRHNCNDNYNGKMWLHLKKTCQSRCNYIHGSCVNTEVNFFYHISFTF